MRPISNRRGFVWSPTGLDIASGKPAGDSLFALAPGDEQQTLADGSPRPRRRGLSLSAA